MDVKINPAYMSINLDKAIDTLWVTGMVDFNYTLNTGGKNFSKLEIYLDSTHLATSYDQNRFSQFNSDSYSSGPHKLRMELWVHSGTGSLGDVFGREYIVSRYEWNLFIDNRILTVPLKIESVSPKNGTLEVKWQKYPYRNFVSYEIYKIELYAPEDPSDNFWKIATITDRSLTSFTDSNFIGGTCKYYIVAKSTKTELSSPRVMFSDNTAEIVSVTPLDDESFKVTWHKHKYYTNFRQYRLYRQDKGSYSWGSKEIAVFNNIQDTTFTDHAGFGKPITYFVKSFGKGNSSVFSKEVAAQTGKPIVNAQTGQPFASGDVASVSYIPELNSFYLNSNTRVDASSMKIMAEEAGRFWISSSGKVAVTNNKNGTSYDPSPHSFTLVNPLTLKPVSQTKYTNDIMGYYSVNSNMAVSETGLCLYAGYRYEPPVAWGPPVTVLLSLDPFKLLMKDSTFHVYGFGQDEMSKLTDEGEYILNMGLQMMNLKNGKLTWLYNTNLQTSSSGNAFLPSGKEFIEVTPGVASVRRCSDYAIIRSIPINYDINGVWLDAATGNLGILNQDSIFYIFDTTTGRIIKQIKVVANSNLCFANSTLFSQNGYYIKLNLN